MGRSGSLKITDFGTDRKPVCEFLLVNNTNLCPIYWYIGQIITFDSRCLYLTPSFEVNPRTLDCKIWPKKTRNFTLLCGAQKYFDTLNHLGMDHQCDTRNHNSNSMHLMNSAKIT